MMSAMDHVPRLQWCFDIDRSGCDARMRDFVQWAHYVHHVPIFITGWFSITSPEPLRALVRAVSGNALAYTPFVDLGAFHVATLSEFIVLARG